MDIKTFQAEFCGEILTSGSGNYEVARRIWNATIARRPTAITRCIGSADVSAAVRFVVDQTIYAAEQPEAEHKTASLKCCDRSVALSRIAALVLE
jgi:hypothetical protein